MQLNGFHFFDDPQNKVEVDDENTVDGVSNCFIGCVESNHKLPLELPDDPAGQ